MGPKIFKPNNNWSNVKLLDGLYLSVHKDLPINSKEYASAKVTLLGYALDPFHPNYSEGDILDSLNEKFTDFKTFINTTKHLAGRWVIIFLDHKGVYMFTDPCGFRQVYYVSDGSQLWCASQPELINANHQLLFDTDYNLKQFLLSKEFAREESFWVGSRSLYQGCYHLLPNHYLDLINTKPIRFFPSEAIEENTTNEVIEICILILSGILAALNNRSEIVMALTSGWESRIMLAASREINSDIEYFVDRKGIITNKHPDVWVPEQMAKKLNLKFTIRNSDYELPGWFVHLLSNNVTGARIIPKTKMIYDKLINNDERIYVNGNGGEICRISEYRKTFEKNNNFLYHKCNSDELIRFLGYESIPKYALKEIENWLCGFELHKIDNMSILDLLYWEQRLGNWGSLYPSEQDIAVEEISPFNCRLLIETLLSSSREKRSMPDYPLYIDLINKMWPEVLVFPINPKTRFYKVKTLKSLYRIIAKKILYV